MTLTIENFKFGIENEYVRVSNSDLVNYVNANCSIPMTLQRYGHSVPRNWKVTTDQTVSTNYDFSTGNGNGGEIVSPILQGQNGLDQIEEIFTHVNSFVGDNINRQCGFHVHLSWDGMTPQQIKKIADRWIVYEDSIDEFMPSSRRGDNNRWCRSNKSYSSYHRMIQGLTENDLRRFGYRVSRQGTRYMKLNFHPLSRQGTIEFRNHSGTTDPKKIINWVKFLIGFVQSAISSSFDAKTYKRKGKRIHSEIREILEDNNWTYKIAGGQCKMISPTNNEFVFSYDEINAFYDNKTSTFLRTGVSTRNTKLNDRFNECLRNFGILTQETDSGLYYKQDQSTIDFYENRKASL